MPNLVLFLWLLAAIAMSSQALAEPVTEKRARELENLVRQDCGSCHGMTLKGGLGPDIRAGRFAGLAPESVAQIILDGVPGTPMPPWRPLLSEAEAHWIADYLIRGGNQ
jgi:cytochrome c55X